MEKIVFFCSIPWLEISLPVLLPELPHLWWPPGLLPFYLQLEKIRLPRDNNQSWKIKEKKMKQTIILKLYMATQQEEKRPESRRKSRRSLQDEACLMYAHTEVLVLDVTVSVSSFLPCLFHSEFFVLLVSSIPSVFCNFSASSSSLRSWGWG